MAQLTDFVAIRLILPGWPTGILAIPPLIDNIGLARLETTTSGFDAISANGTLQIINEISMDMPLIPGLSLALLNESNFTEIEFDIEYFSDYFGLTLLSLSAALRVDSKLLKRMENVNGTFIEVPPDPLTGDTLPVEIQVDGASLSINSNADFSFTFSESAPALTILPFMIGDSGVIVEVNRLQLILSAAVSTNLPKGIPTDWRGVFLESATIHLPPGLQDILPESIQFNDAFIGSGGFSGAVFLDLSDEVTAYDAAKAKTVLGFGFTFVSIDLAFLQNTITRCSIKGYLKIPFFDEAVEVELGITNEGDVTIAVSSNTGLLTLTKQGIIEIALTSLEFIKEANNYSVRLSGKVTPLLVGFNWPSFELKALTISSDGTVKVEGGWIELPELKALDFHGFSIEITKLGFGSEDIDGIPYKWIGFSGGIQVVSELPLRGGMEGLKILWSDNGAVKLKIGGVYLSFTIEDVLRFDGAVYFIDEPGIKEFRGGVSLNLIPVNLSIDAQFITGRDLAGNFNYFYIFIGLELPVGIPLGPTGLGLYGLSGLYGHNMGLDYQQLINYPDVGSRPDLSDATIWDKQKGAKAFGAGLTIGTLPDTMFTVKAKALFLILIPGPVLLIEGHAGILSTGESFVLRVLAVLDTASGTFLMNIDAGYMFPKNSGDLLDITGSAEAFFSGGDPDAWHLYLGENNPKSKRIRADILSFFKAQTYLMVDHSGLLMGAWIGYGLDKKYGVLSVVLEAWISGELELSLMPLQAKGAITLYGNAELSVSIVSLGISVEAHVSAEAPKPLSIAASMQVQLKTPLGKPKATIKLKWEKSGEPSYPIPLSAMLGIEHRKVSKNWEVAKSSRYAVDEDKLYDEQGDEMIVSPVVPLVPPDILMVLNFDKPMEDASGVGINPSPAPGMEKIGAYEFKYVIKDIVLEYRDNWNEQTTESGWLSYEDFVKRQVDDDTGAYALTGSWQIIPGTGVVNNTKLVLNATTPFEISRILESAESWWGMVDLYQPNYPCIPNQAEEFLCADVEHRAIGIYYNALVENGVIFSSPYPMSVTGYAASWLGTTHALNNTDSYITVECLEIDTQPATAHINIKAVKRVVITAGIGYNSYLEFTNAYSGAGIELYINTSVAGPNHFPAFISFPETAFENTPYVVYVTCAVADGADGTFLIASDKDNNVVATARYKTNIPTGGTSIYKLESSSLPIRRISITGIGIRIMEICFEEYHRVETSVILTTAPLELFSAYLHFSKGSHGEIFLYNKDNAQLQQVSFDVPAIAGDNDLQPIMLAPVTGSFRSWLITGSFKLIRSCCVTVEAHEIFTNNVGLSKQLQASLDESWGRHTAQILHPGKYYRLNITTATNRRKNGGDWTEKTFTEFLYFKTGNPPGPPAEMQINSPEAIRYEQTEPLKDLSGYIAYSIPAAGVADEPQPLIYRSYDIGVVFNDSYIEQMYRMAGLEFSIRLTDNNQQQVTNADGQLLIMSNAWGDNPARCLTREEQHYKDLLDESGCIVISTSVEVESNSELIASSRELLLRPTVQYRAELMADANTPVYTFNFLSSRYASFRHHMHSFADIIWNHFALHSNPLYNIDSNRLEMVLANTEPGDIQFEQLMLLFDLYPRTLPSQIEMMLINDSVASYGFLFESPEPLDWDRCTCSLEHAAVLTQVSEHSGIIKIVGGNITQGNEFIEILVMESSNLSAFIIEYQQLNETESNNWQVYFQFAPGSAYPAGTLLRIRNSPEQETNVSAAEEVILYTGDTDALLSGNLSFRIKNSEREILHTRVIHFAEEFTVKPVRNIFNVDGTRCFIFLPWGTTPFSKISAGLYKLTWTFQRSIGIAKPTLKRFGFSDAEVAILEFSVA